jgi:hypothetical protein
MHQGREWRAELHDSRRRNVDISHAVGWFIHRQESLWRLLCSKQVYVAPVVDLVHVIADPWLVVRRNTALHEVEDASVEQRVNKRVAVS